MEPMREFLAPISSEGNLTINMMKAFFKDNRQRVSVLELKIYQPQHLEMVSNNLEFLVTFNPLLLNCLG